jgi:hypothetical protein
LKRHTDIIPERVKELAGEFNNDMALNDMNLKEKTLLCPTIKCKWSQINYEEIHLLKKMEQARAALMESYVSQYGQQGVPKFKTEQEAKQNDKIKTLDKAIEEQKDVNRFLDGVMKIVLGFGFDIKSAVDMTKMENM